MPIGLYVDVSYPIQPAYRVDLAGLCRTTAVRKSEAIILLKSVVCANIIDDQGVLIFLDAWVSCPYYAIMV